MSLADRLRDDRQRRKEVFEGRKQEIRADHDASKARATQWADAARGGKSAAADRSSEDTSASRKPAQPAVTPEAIAARKAEQDGKTRRNGLVVVGVVVVAVIGGFVLSGSSDDANDPAVAVDGRPDEAAPPEPEPDPEPEPEPEPEPDPRDNYPELWEESAGQALDFYGEDPISMHEDYEMWRSQNAVESITGYDWVGSFGFVRTDLHPDNPESEAIAESLCNVATTGLFGTELLDEVTWVEVTGQFDRQLATCKPIGQR